MITWENGRERMRADMKLRDYRPRTRDGDELAAWLFISLRTIQAILGHESLRTTELYIARDAAGSRATSRRSR